MSCFGFEISDSATLTCAGIHTRQSVSHSFFRRRGAHLEAPRASERVETFFFAALVHVLFGAGHVCPIFQPGFLQRRVTEVQREQRFSLAVYRREIEPKSVGRPRAMQILIWWCSLYVMQPGRLFLKSTQARSRVDSGTGTRGHVPQRSTFVDRQRLREGTSFGIRGPRSKGERLPVPFPRVQCQVGPNGWGVQCLDVSAFAGSLLSSAAS